MQKYMNHLPLPCHVFFFSPTTVLCEGNNDDMATEINVSNIYVIALGGCSASGTQAQTVEEENGCEHTRMHTKCLMK